MESIAGAILRNALANAKNEVSLPTIILSPNLSGQVQWRDQLHLNGGSPSNLLEFRCVTSRTIGPSLYS